MTANSDSDYERYRNTDFSNAKPVAQVPHLRQLQAEAALKIRVSLSVDHDVLEIFRVRAQSIGQDYLALMSSALAGLARGDAAVDAKAATPPTNISPAAASGSTDFRRADKQ